MSGLDHPPAPWHMHGQLWLSLFRARGTTWGVGLVGYEDPSPLTYSELLVARAVKDPVKGVSISQIWVDSPASLAGGRELWAIPKELCDFTFESTRTGPLTSASWSASLGHRSIVQARFKDTSSLAPRLPFTGATWQPGLDGGPDRTSSMTGSARSVPCLGSWTFDPDGPLGWLGDARPWMSVRMRDFRMSFD